MSGKFNNTIWFVYIVICFLQFSCDKDASSISRPKGEILATNKWKVKNLYIRDKGEPLSGNTEARAFTYKDCELDDIYFFKSDSVFVRSDSLVACDPLLLDPFHVGVFGPYGSGKWSIDASFTQMKVTNLPFYNFTWKILTITEVLFEVEQNHTDIFGQQYVYTYRFSPLK